MKNSLVLSSLIFVSTAFSQTIAIKDCNENLLGREGQAQCIAAIKSLILAGKEVTDDSITEFILQTSPETRNYDATCLSKLLYENDKMVTRSREETEACRI